MQAQRTVLPTILKDIVDDDLVGEAENVIEMFTGIIGEASGVGAA